MIPLLLINATNFFAVSCETKLIALFLAISLFDPLPLICTPEIVPKLTGSPFPNLEISAIAKAALTT